MDIRVVSESIFNIESDCIVYFVDNAFSNEDTMEIITKAGNRLLDVFSKISSLATGEFKTVPAFNLKATYVLVEIERHKFNTLAVDVTRLSNSYSSKHSEILKKFLRYVSDDVVVFMCK